MFQIERLSGGVFWVYDVDTVENMFLIYRDDNWNWIEMETCKPYYPPSDAIQIVRCKDCKHWQRHTGVVDSPNGHCFAIETCKNGMDFCSYGEYQKNTGGVTHD